jgi:hypothetical protein
MDTIDNVQMTEQNKQDLVDYLSNVAYLIIDIKKEALYKELFLNSELINNFAQERNTKMICLSKIEILSVEQGNSNNFQIQITTEMPNKNSKSSTCCFIKRESSLEFNPERSLSSQIQVLNFSGEATDTNMLSFMQNYIQNAFTPFFNTAQNSGNERNLSNSNQIKSTTMQTLQNKMSELVFLLNQSQKNSDIPSVRLELEGDFKQIYMEIKTKDKEPTVDDFQDKITDDFISKLVNTINRWKVDISGLLKLDRQIAHGNTLQEVTFWKDYENSLTNSIIKNFKKQKNI